MKQKSLTSLTQFVKNNNLTNIPADHIINVLRNTYQVLEAIEDFHGSFEDFLESLYNHIWSKDIWDYWENVYYFRGEISMYCKEQHMELEEAIETVAIEYDFI